MSWIRRCSIVLVGSLVSGLTREGAFIGRALPKTACRCRAGSAGDIHTIEFDGSWRRAVRAVVVGLGNDGLKEHSSGLSHRHLLPVM